MSMRKWPDIGWCHVWQQSFQHSPALIRGNRVALLNILAAIDEALNNTEGEATASLMASDGEGYSLIVQRCTTMAGLGRPEYLYERVQEQLAYERRVAWSPFKKPTRQPKDPSPSSMEAP